ncbi:hypothetical protein QS257_03400 [Terrilactibacillus sp. S3-3]|nr:hypothetical protein QS257_03400 [Terrilactibacillus sp. S3-3]
MSICSPLYGAICECKRRVHKTEWSVQAPKWRGVFGIENGAFTSPKCPSGKGIKESSLIMDRSCLHQVFFF